MVKYLIQRPVAVLMTFAVLLITGIVFIRKVPVSLLPDVDVPRIVVRVNYPNTASTVLEKTILQPVRESLVNCDHLKSIESRAGNHTGLIYLTFDYGTRMSLAYIEVNEKLDRLSSSLPRDMARPQVMRINTSDIPVIRLQILPKEGTRFQDISSLAELVLKKRLEQLDGVSLVDLNGKQRDIITVTPDKEALSAFGLTESFIVQAIQNANRELGGLSIKDGQYRYFVKVLNSLEDENAIAQLPVRLKDGSVIALNRLAKVQLEPEKQTGYHLYNGKEGIVITIQKQPSSRMNELVPAVEKLVKLFKTDYPQAEFELTQDQTFLLDAGIGNLKQDLLYGGILTILLLFLFLGNWASPLLMSISIPLSLIITFIFFYLFNISFNIISLSGLALGVGMLIDNSIVVIDNITRKRSSGMNMLDSSVNGTNEVITPVISQVLTTVAVYAPLILLSGMAGALVYDQAIGLTISLGVSLLVAFILSPLLYKIFLRTPPEKLKEDTIFYKWVARGYHKMINHILKRKLFYFIVTILIMPIGFLLAGKIPVSALPSIEKKESLVQIDWNDPSDAQENLKRVQELLSVIKSVCTVTEAEVGIRQFLLQQDNNAIQKSEIYFGCVSEKNKVKADGIIKKWIAQKYPSADIQIMDAPNAFTQLFSSQEPYFEVRFSSLQGNESKNSFAGMAEILKQLPDKQYTLGAGLLKEPEVSLTLDYHKMATLGVTKQQVEEALQQQFGIFTVSELRRFGEVKTIRLKTDKLTLESKLATTVTGSYGASYPLSYFISVSNGETDKFITAGRTGEYKSLIFEKAPSNTAAFQSSITKIAGKYRLSAEFTGQYFENRAQIKQMRLIFFLVLCLLFFILAMQYESLVQPVIVMLTIPLGITGGMFFLWITGGTLDVMAAIGFVVILGLIVDDPILKIETLNRLEQKYLSEGLTHNDKLLERMIHEAGAICLKPLLMVSLTTSIALVPVLFVGGIGNDLQKPLSVVIIGGLTIGTFFTTWFIPLAYWYVTKWRKRI